jgi:hypothetical protein
VKRRELLNRMARIARSYGIEFDKDHPVHGGRHDKFFVGSHSVEVPATQKSPSTPRGGS